MLFIAGYCCANHGHIIIYICEFKWPLNIFNVRKRQKSSARNTLLIEQIIVLMTILSAV